VKPEAAAYLDKAREALAKAEGMLDRWPDEAGREAYFGGLCNSAYDFGFVAAISPSIRLRASIAS
jgi:hypothetical protein